MNKVRKIKQAAKILSSFNFEGIGLGFYDISIYFRTVSGECVGVGVDSIEPEDKNALTDWGKDEWEAFLSENAKFYKNNWEPVRVELIRMSFVLDDDEEENWLEAPIYRIEMTDISSGLFDRTIVGDGLHGLKEAYLTEPESRKIRGVRDVVKLSKEISSARLETVSSDLPVCVAREREDWHRYVSVCEELET